MALRIGGMASHGGTNLRHIDAACAQGSIDAELALLISNNGDAAILGYARERQIARRHLSAGTHPEADELDRAILDALEANRVDVVFLSGYMKKLGPRTVGAFPNRILNVHPALLPKYGGQGMYGDRVYEAVLAAGETATGATIHLVDNEYDHGATVLARKVPIPPGAIVEDLRTRVRECERELCLDVVGKLATGEIDLDDIARRALVASAQE